MVLSWSAYLSRTLDTHPKNCPLLFEKIIFLIRLTKQPKKNYLAPENQHHFLKILHKIYRIWQIPKLFMGSLQISSSNLQIPSHPFRYQVWSRKCRYWRLQFEQIYKLIKIFEFKSNFKLEINKNVPESIQQISPADYRQEPILHKQSTVFGNQPYIPHPPPVV